MINIIIADDHQIVRDGLKALLSGSDEIAVTGEAADGEELLAILKTTAADIILLDVSMPGKSGIEICKLLQQAHPGIRVIFLSMYSGEEFVLQGMRAGAMGYLPKNIPRQELVCAIQEVYSGGNYLSPELSNIWMKELLLKARDSGQNTLSLLSKRELEILKLCAEGNTNKDISDKLFICVRTVESHKTHIMQKLELKTTAELIRFAVKHNLVNF